MSKEPLILEAIFLDLGGVIFEIDWQYPLSLLEPSDEQQKTEILRKIWHSPDLHEFERGRRTGPEFLAALNSLLQLNRDYAFLERAWNSLIVGPLPGAEKIFAHFKGRVPIYALSNTNVIHHQHCLNHFPIINEFDDVLTSYELGERKPDAEIFQKAAQKMGVAPERCVFIDDLTLNLEAARTMGFLAHQSVNSTEQTMEILARYLP